MAFTRLGSAGYGVRHAGSFSGKTASSTSAHPVDRITRLGSGGYGVRRYRPSAFAGKGAGTTGSGEFIVAIARRRGRR